MCSYHRHNIRFQDIVCLKLKLNGQDIKKYQQKGHNLIKCETDKKTRNYISLPCDKMSHRSLACVAADSFPFSGGAEIEQVNEKRASEGARLG